MMKLTEEKRHNAIGRLPAWENQGDVAQHKGGGGVAEPLLTGFGGVTITQVSRDRPR